MITDLVERLRETHQRRALDDVVRMSLDDCARLLRILEEMQAAGSVGDRTPVAMAKARDRLVEAGLREQVV